MKKSFVVCMEISRAISAGGAGAVAHFAGLFELLKLFEG
jgi:hypothetical protein